MKTRLFVLVTLVAAACRSYELPKPSNFESEPVSVSGKLSELAIGEHKISGFHRGWTRGGGTQVMSVKSEERTQKYEFRVTDATGSASDVRCEFGASEGSIGLKSGWELMTGEGAALRCTLSHGDTQSQLELMTEGDEVLAGTLKGARTFRVQGVGSAMFSKGKKGPATGFYFYDGDAVVAVTQIISPRQVLFARSADAGQRAELVPAIAALLLLDESVREF